MIDPSNMLIKSISHPNVTRYSVFVCACVPTMLVTFDPLYPGKGKYVYVGAKSMLLYNNVHMYMPTKSFLYSYKKMSPDDR